MEGIGGRLLDWHSQDTGLLRFFQGEQGRDGVTAPSFLGSSPKAFTEGVGKASFCICKGDIWILEEGEGEVTMRQPWGEGMPES